MTTSLEELIAERYKRWYQYGRRSPSILYRRLRNKHHPVSDLRTFWQRGRRGYAISDTWSLDYYLARVIAGGVSQLRFNSHGHPADTTPEEWLSILGEIEEGMRASLRMAEAHSFGDGPDKERFDRAMELLHEWWFALWD